MKKQKLSTKPGAPSGGGRREVRAATARKQEQLQLVAGLRDRLLVELDATGVPPHRRVSTLCRITGRKSPTVRRWMDPERPGLPDLESFARLCQKLTVSVEYLLGLSDERELRPASHRPRGAPGAVDSERTAGRALDDCEPMVMSGDDMEPRIKDGDVLFVDRRVNTVLGNGTYVVTYMGRTMVRNVEDRFAAGFALRCANERYSDVIVANGLESSGVAILGKVVARQSITAL